MSNSCAVQPSTSSVGAKGSWLHPSSSHFGEVGIGLVAKDRLSPGRWGRTMAKRLEEPDSRIRRQLVRSQLDPEGQQEPRSSAELRKRCCTCSASTSEAANPRRSNACSGYTLGTLLWITRIKFISPASFEKTSRVQ